MPSKRLIALLPNIPAAIKETRDGVQLAAIAHKSFKWSTNFVHG